MRTVLLVDDHPVVAVGLRLAFQESQQFKLVGVLTNPADGLANMTARQPDAVVVDLVFEGVVQLHLIAECRTALPAAAIVVFSSLPEHLYGRQAMAAGANAYLNKSSDLSVLSQLLADLIWPPTERSSPGREGGSEPRSPHTSHDGVHLTQREIEIAGYVGRGLSIGVIAQELGISANTAAVHRDNIRKKLNCRDTKDLVARLARMDGFGDVTG